MYVCGETAKTRPEQIDLHKRARDAMLRFEKAIKPGALTTDVFNACGKENVLGGIVGHSLGVAAFELPYIVPESLVPQQISV